MRAFNLWQVSKTGELHNVKLIDLRYQSFRGIWIQMQNWFYSGRLNSWFENTSTQLPICLQSESHEIFSDVNKKDERGYLKVFDYFTRLEGRKVTRDCLVMNHFFDVLKNKK